MSSDWSLERSFQNFRHDLIGGFGKIENRHMNALFEAAQFLTFRVALTNKY